MLDKKKFTTLKILNGICEDGVYKVIDFNSLMSKFPNRYKMEKVYLDQILNYLKSGKFIDIKHSEDDTYCLTVLPKGNVVLDDTTKEVKTLKKLNKSIVFAAFFSGVMSFLGAFLALYLYTRGII